MNKKNNWLCVVAAIILFLSAGVLIFRNVVAFTQYDKVNATVRINYEHSTREEHDRVAYLTYAYKGEVYSDVRTMNYSSSWANGKTIGIYVNPSNPRDFVIIGYFAPIACLVLGGIFTGVGVAIAKRNYY